MHDLRTAQVLQGGGRPKEVGEMLWDRDPPCTRGYLYSHPFLRRRVMSWAQRERGELGCPRPWGALHFLLLSLFRSNDVQATVRSERVTSLLPGRRSGVNDVGEVNGAVDWTYRWWSCAGHYKQRFSWCHFSLSPHLFLSVCARACQENTHFTAACLQRPYAEQWPRMSLKPCEHFCSPRTARAKAWLWIMAHPCTEVPVHTSKKGAGGSVMLNDTTLGFSSLIFPCPGNGRSSSLRRWCFFGPYSAHVHSPGIGVLCTAEDGVTSGSWCRRDCCVGTP